MAEMKGSSITLHAHGDGSYHTISHGSNDYGMIGHGGKEPGRVEHPSFGHAVMHMAKMHAEGDHMHILSHNEGFTSHHVLEGASVQGPHESDTVGQLKTHVESALQEEADED